MRLFLTAAEVLRERGDAEKFQISPQTGAGDVHRYLLPGRSFICFGIVPRIDLHLSVPGLMKDVALISPTLLVQLWLTLAAVMASQ